MPPLLSVAGLTRGHGRPGPSGPFQASSGSLALHDGRVGGGGQPGPCRRLPGTARQRPRASALRCTRSTPRLPLSFSSGSHAGVPSVRGRVSSARLSTTASTLRAQPSLPCSLRGLEWPGLGGRGADAVCRRPCDMWGRLVWGGVAPSGAGGTASLPAGPAAAPVSCEVPASCGTSARLCRGQQSPTWLLSVDICGFVFSGF